MLTEEGHAKIIDFGLAKLVEPLSGASEIETRLQRETDPGVVMGTVSYMSPEQARGLALDHRSDVFSSGIVLYEMLSDQLPLRGQSGLDTLHAILRSPAPPLPSLAPDASPEVPAELDRILAKCLAKDPAERYQTIKDVAVDLRASRRRLDSAFVTGTALTGAAIPSLRRPRRLYAAAAVLALVLAGAAAFYLRGDRARPLASLSAKPSVAVLYFENNTGDPSLDWLRTALTDMLVTDLSQSPQVEVLGTDRLYQILQEMNRLDERITSFNVVQEVAQKANVQTVLLGSFLKAGDAIRISIRLQDASSGRILTSDKVEGVGEASIFPMVDDLTRRIKARFEVPATADAELDRDLKDVTTASIEAYRPYAEGINLAERGKYREAVPLMEKAVAIDPGFSMALAKLSILQSNLFHLAESKEYARRALEHLDRLTARERYYIEGVYYSRNPETIGRAIEAYERAVELYPNHSSARNNLAILYGTLGRDEEAIVHYEELRRRGIVFSGTYSNLAAAYATEGELQKGYDVLQEYLQRNPDIAAAHTALGEHLTTWRRLEEALEAFGKAEALEPGTTGVESGRWVVFIFREDWSQAEAAARKLQGSQDVFAKWLGTTNMQFRELYRGRSQEAL
jgi:TolB-like protein